MHLSRIKAGLAVSLVGATALALWMTVAERPAESGSPVVLPASQHEPIAPDPLATSPVSLTATLRASETPPSPELLRDNPQAQAAYDASAKPGDFVTPPSVSVEH